MVGDILSGVVFGGVFGVPKNLVKVSRIEEAMSKTGPSTLRNLSFQFHY